MAALRAGILRRFRLLQSQAIDAHPFWVLIGCLLLAYVIAEVNRSIIGAAWIYVFGITIEIFGVLFVAIEIASVRKLVGKPGFLTAIYSWVSKFRDLFLKPKPINVSLSATLGGVSFFGRARLTQGTKSSKLKDRIEMLENNIGKIHKELDQVYKLIEDTEKNSADAINEKAKILTEKIEAQGRLVAEIAAGDSALKLVGVFLVLLGFMIQNFPRNWAPAPLF